MDFSPHAFTAALFCNTHARTTLSARTGGERTRRVKKLKEETKFSSHVKYVAVSPRDGDGGSGGERERGGEGEVGAGVVGGGEGEEESGRLPRPKTSSGQPTSLAVLSESR